MQSSHLHHRNIIKLLLKSSASNVDSWSGIRICSQVFVEPAITYPKSNACSSIVLPCKRISCSKWRCRISNGALKVISRDTDAQDKTGCGMFAVKLALFISWALHFSPQNDSLKHGSFFCCNSYW